MLWEIPEDTNGVADSLQANSYEDIIIQFIENKLINQVNNAKTLRKANVRCFQLCQNSLNHKNILNDVEIESYDAMSINKLYAIENRFKKVYRKILLNKS